MKKKIDEELKHCPLHPMLNQTLHLHFQSWFFAEMLLNSEIYCQIWQCCLSFPGLKLMFLLSIVIHVARFQNLFHCSGLRMFGNMSVLTNKKLYRFFELTIFLDFRSRLLFFGALRRQPSVLMITSLKISWLEEFCANSPTTVSFEIKLDMVSKLQKNLQLHWNMLHSDAGTSKLCISSSKSQIYKRNLTCTIASRFFSLPSFGHVVHSPFLWPHRPGTCPDAVSDD